VTLMHVGFTGTRHSLTVDQSEALSRSLAALKEKGFTVLHHGDCVGADEWAVTLARTAGYRIVAHPPTDPKARAMSRYDETRTPEPYLKRNEKIVEEADILVACPESRSETLRSGSWATIRRARKKGIPIVIIDTNGIVTLEGDQP
jgi:hypothetical protein